MKIQAREDIAYYIALEPAEQFDVDRGAYRMRVEHVRLTRSDGVMSDHITLSGHRLRKDGSLGGIDRDRFGRYLSDNPEVQAIVQQATQDGRIKPDEVPA